MELLNSLYLNYYSVGMLAASILTILSGIFLFMLPEKSKTTIHLGLSVLFGGGFSMCYFLSQGLYHSYPFIRPLLLILILLHQIHTVQFILRFPDHNRPKFTRKLHLTHYAISSIFFVFLIRAIFVNPTFYDFNGHYFEMRAPALLKAYSGFALVNALLITGFGVWKVVITKTGERPALLGILIAMFIAEIGGASLNVLNKLGFIDRAGFIGLFAFLTTIGYFGLLVSYLNKSKDRTTFMFKVVGSSFVTFILVFSFMALMIFNDVESKYDILKNTEAKIVLSEEDRPPELEYVAVYNPEEDEFSFKFSKENVALTKDIRWKMYLAWLYYRVQNSSDLSGLLEKIKEEKGNKYSKPYLELLEANQDREPIDVIKTSKRNIFYKGNKIKELPNEEFRTHLIKLLESEKGDFGYFKTAILEYIEKINLEDEELKNEVSHFLLLLQAPEERTYREGSNGNHYIGYQIIKPESGLVYEIGFSYRDYRLYTHQTGKTMIYVLFMGVVLIVMGTPIFLSGTLMNPLRTLLNGVREVRKGKLDTHIPVKVNDEIGYLSASFNSMVESIRDSKKKLEEYADQLEEKVEERTKELQFSLAQVEFLKSQQDGDYFLTTLLLKPLGVKNVQSQNIKVDFFVKQKKEFNFKSRSHEIGGDICISQDITLRNQKYIVFLNADAMGKSIQGAGGILVLGAVFQSIIQRTVSYKSHSEMAPEQWIKAAFKEMHKIFESFDGSMLISLVFGVVEDQTGLVYYINAEHPWIILYRDKKAEFIEDDLKFRKLGTAGVAGDFYVSMFKMEAGDILIMGSDGKDDLVMKSKTDSSGRVINEDETLILDRIQEADGDINGIFQSIKSRYELMDDFSLLSLSFKEEEAIAQLEEPPIDVHELIHSARKQAIQGNLDNSIAILEKAYDQKTERELVVPYLTRVYMKKQRYGEAAKICKEHLQAHAVDTPLMFRASYCLKLNREFDEAIDLAERVKLREPLNVKNLVHLADLYTVNGNIPRAVKLLKKAKQIDPDNKKILMIQEVLDRKTDEEAVLV